MKNSKKILISILTVMACSVFFVGCGDKADSSSSDTAKTVESQTETETEPETTIETTTEPTTEKTTENPVDSLISTDKDLYDAMIKLSADFKNPSSIRIVSKVRADFTGKYKISGENSFGGTVSAWYRYNPDTKTLEASSIDYDSMNVELMSDSMDIKEVNKALEYHFSEMGY
ncbi:MAG: hypothetical protein NC177_02885 [Ruminococcus flavefaciens]|nr:hypothetical protein [Ruminococcus flavefaciens]